MIKSKKLLFVIDVMRSGGGAQKVLLILLKTLKKNGLQTKLIVLKKTQELVDLQGVDVEFILQDENAKLTTNTFVILDSITKSAQGFDVMVSFMDFITSYFVALSAGILKMPYYCFVRCKPSYAENNFPQPQINHNLYAFCLQNAQKVVCNSKSSYLDIENNFQVAREKIYLLYNPIDTQQILQKASESLVEVYKDPGTILCVSVGRLHPVKNYKTLLKAFLKLKDFNLALWILGDGEQREELECFIRANTMQNVKILGYQYNIYPYLKIADIFIHSSLSEGFSNAVLEAAFLRKPLILSDIPVHRELFTKESAEFFMPENAGELASLLGRLASDSGERIRLSKGAERVIASCQNESFEKMLGQIFAFEKPSDNGLCAESEEDIFVYTSSYFGISAVTKE